MLWGRAANLALRFRSAGQHALDPLVSHESMIADPVSPNSPRSLADTSAVGARQKLLSLPHIAPLAAFAEELRQRTGAEVPDFDPLDGGTNASILFLFEKPGPMTSLEGKRRGSGFISRDNNDPTAEATFRFMIEAGIPRRDTVTWNVVPGWNGTRAITGDELRSGIAELNRLLDLLPATHTVVLVGRRAQTVAANVASRGLRVIASFHPSPLVRASRPAQWAAIGREWASARC